MIALSRSPREWRLDKILKVRQEAGGLVGKSRTKSILKLNCTCTDMRARFGHASVPISLFSVGIQM